MLWCGSHSTEPILFNPYLIGTMKNLKDFARNDKILTDDLRTFVDWVITATSRELDKFCTITYRKKRTPNQTKINEWNTELEELNRNLARAIENEEPALVISGLRNEINSIEGLINREGENIRRQPAKVVVNEEDLPFFLRLIDESWKIEVYEALKFTGLRLNEFINPDPTREPSPQGILETDPETWAWIQRRTREYTWNKKEED